MASRSLKWSIVTMSMSALFENTQNLPNIPKVVQELIETFNTESVDADEIAGKVSMDAVLTAKVLRLANSAHYGVSRTISSTQDAVVLLGLNSLRTLVLASGFTTAVVMPDGFEKRVFWKDTFSVSAFSKHIAKETDVNLETAFTCGMLHSLGELLIHTTYPIEGKKVLEAIEKGGSRFQTEKSIFGFDYADVGAELAKRWKFPDDVIDAIQFQNNPTETDQKLAGVLHLAKYFKRCQDNKMTGAQTLEGFPKDAALQAGIDPKKAKDFLEELDGLESGFDALIDD